MRKEASLEQWRALYEVATRIKELKPWEKFWDMDLIGISSGAEEDTVFYSILGRGGDCYGIAVYEGYEGFNSFRLEKIKKHGILVRHHCRLHRSNSVICILQTKNYFQTLPRFLSAMLCWNRMMIQL